MDYTKIHTMNDIEHPLHGYRVYHWPHMIKYGPAIDSGPCINIPRTLHSMTSCWLYSNILNDHLSNSIHAGAGLFLSKYNEDHVKNVKLYELMIEQLGNNGEVHVWIPKWECFAIGNYELGFRGDMKVMLKYNNGSQPAGASYGISDAILIVEGKLRGVRSTEWSWRLFLIYKPSDEVDPPLTWRNDRTKKTFSLNTYQFAMIKWNQIYKAKEHYKSTKVTPAKLAKWTKSDESTLIARFAERFKTSQIRKPNVGSYCGSAQVKHAMWSVYKFGDQLMVATMWCVWKWKSTTIVKLVKLMEVDLFTIQVQNYLTHNPTKSLKNKFVVSLPGIYVNKLNYFFVKFMCHSSYYCCNCVQTMNLAVMFVIMQNIRFAFHVFHIHHFKKPLNGEKNKLIEQMWNSCKFAFYLAEELLSPMVCFIHILHALYTLHELLSLYIFFTITYL